MDYKENKSKATHKTLPKCSITQLSESELGRSVEANTVTQLVMPVRLCQ